MSQPRDGEPAREPVGSVGEEAAKLFGVFAQWAQAQGDAHGDAAPTSAGSGASGEAEPTDPTDPTDPSGPAAGPAATASGLAGRAAAAARGLEEHVATGSAECTYCPVCRTIHLVRQTSPEVRTHLLTAFSSLTKAAEGLLATATPPPTDPPTRPGGPRPRGEGVERIDLDRAETWDDPENPNLEDER